MTFLNHVVNRFMQTYCSKNLKNNKMGQMNLNINNWVKKGLTTLHIGLLQR